MGSSPQPYDVAVIGAGFFGCQTAISLAEKGLKVLVVEREKKPFQHASQFNQARVHNGYHYPRSLMTAIGSHRHYERFLADYADCIVSDFCHVYAIANLFSKVTATQFKSFCKTLDIPLKPVPSSLTKQFNSGLVESLFVVDEAGVDTALLAKQVGMQLNDLSRISILTGHCCERLSIENTYVALHTNLTTFKARSVVIAGYSGINKLLMASNLKPLALKTEITEMALVRTPKSFHKAGVTVMDGPFFSCMPYGKGDTHTLSHVRYTPHASLDEIGSEDPYKLLAAYKANATSRYPFMRNDAARYVPVLRESKYLDSFYEAKTVPQKHEIDDGRPILVREHIGHLGKLKEPAIVSLLGSKLDSIYEWEALLAEKFS